MVNDEEAAFRRTISREPIAIEETLAFREFTDGTGDLGPVSLPKYAPIPGLPNELLRLIRQCESITLSAAALRLGMTPLQLSNLERGAEEPEVGWGRFLEHARKVMKA